MYCYCTVHTIDAFQLKKFEINSHFIDITIASNIINECKKKNKMH